MDLMGFVKYILIRCYPGLIIILSDCGMALFNFSSPCLIALSLSSHKAVLLIIDEASMNLKTSPNNPFERNKSLTD